MAPIQNATQKMPNPTQGPMVPQNAEAGSCTHEIKLVCECFPLGEAAQQKPASSPSKPASRRSHQWCCGKNLRSLLVGQLFGRPLDGR